MPRGDGTGPAGMGPMSGRAAGYCAGYSVPGFMNPVWGRGGGWFGRGRGLAAPGWGWGPAYGWPPYAEPYSPEQEKQALEGQLKYFESQVESLRKRIAELEKEAVEPKE